MAKNKTTANELDVMDFINSYVDNDQKKEDSLQLIEYMSQWSGFEPKMWGPSIIGFGYYEYKYASGREGKAPLIGFSPRKPAFSLYVYSPTEETEPLLERFGKFKMSKSCIYVKKLSDIDIVILEKFCRATIAYLNEHRECAYRRSKASKKK
ncbi:MAG: DUF1801 domain-containing protein [Bacteroidota bacterium]